MTRSRCREHRGRHHARWWASRTLSALDTHPARPTAPRGAPRGFATRPRRPSTPPRVSWSTPHGPREPVGPRSDAPWASPAKQPDKQHSAASSSTTARAEAKTWNMPLPVHRRRRTVVQTPRSLLSAASLRGWGPAPPQRPPSSGAGSPKGLPERPHPHPAGSPRASDVYAPRRADGCTRHDQPSEMDGRRQSDRLNGPFRRRGRDVSRLLMSSALFGRVAGATRACPHSWGTLITRSTVRTRVQAEISRATNTGQRIGVPSPPAHEAAQAPRPFLATPSLAVRPQHRGRSRPPEATGSADERSTSERDAEVVEVFA